jgi:signal transduction histidine kinase
LSPLQTEFLQTTARNTDRLVTIVNDLLDISSIESGKMELRLASVDLTDVVPREVELLKAQLEGKNMGVSIDIPKDVPHVWADARRLGQVISNLLSNAVKYSREDSTVMVTAERVGDNVIVRVADSGIGISPDESDRLFDRFYRSRDDAVRATPGAGLGLAITRYLVEMQGGIIWVESEKGYGSTFSFSIPVSS